MVLSPSKENVAACLLKLGAVKLNTQELFTWASGIQSPVYCDNRVINSDVESRDTVLDAFLEFIKQEFPHADVIAGVATGGIPMGALIADRLRLPFVYVRQEPKSHGLKQQVEGSFRHGDRVVVIEDLISTGGSSMKAIDGIRNAGLELLGLVSIMNYGFNKAADLFAREGVTVFSLCNIDTIVDVALEEKLINQDEADSVIEFRNRVGA
jgi:orotate phosphoribosyltransferase